MYFHSVVQVFKELEEDSEAQIKQSAKTYI